MSYDGILGHEQPIRILTDIVASGQVGSGYLFHGPDGVGKARVAREFARAILCRGAGEPGLACDDCPDCTRSAAGTHRGLVTVRKQAGRTRLRVSQVHELSEELSLRPLAGESKVAVLEDFEIANDEAMNALLKTLEEPPPRTTLVLVTNNREVVAETVRSRCQDIRFGPLPRSDVEEVLRGLPEMSEDEARDLAALSGGSPGRAVRLRDLGYPGLAREADEIIEQARSSGRDPLLTARNLTALLAVGGLEDKRDRVREALMLLTDRVRREYLAAEGADRDPGSADRCLKALAEGFRQLHLNVSPESILRSILVRILPVLAAGDGVGSGSRSR